MNKRLISTTVVILLGGGLFGAIKTKPGCELTGGHWASVSSFCFTQFCYHMGNCGGPWVSPSRPCTEIPIGSSVAQIHFYLGNPQNISDSEQTWEFGKPDTYRVTAKVADGKVVELKCPKPG